MIDAEDILAALESHGVTFFTGVPDSLLKPLLAALSDLPGSRHLIAANEGNAVAIAAGRFLATGEVAAVYLQNSGIGNAINPLLSLADPAVYGIPMILIVGWRGRPGAKDEPQHVKQGLVTLETFDALDIPCFVLEAQSDVRAVMADAHAAMMARSGPVAVVVAPDALAVGPKRGAAEGPIYSLSREQAVGIVASHLDEAAVVVATTGHISRELYEYRLTSGHGVGRDFLTVGSMGHAGSIALGMALGRPDLSVVCLDGDGSALMHMGSLAVTAAAAPPNLIHIVLNNGAHDSVGGQPTVGFACDLRQVAVASGYRTALLADTAEALEGALKQAIGSTGPTFIEVRVRRGARADLGRPRETPRANRDALMQALGVRA